MRSCGIGACSRGETSIAMRSRDTELARGRHGLAARWPRGAARCAMNEAQAALRSAPRDLELHHTSARFTSGSQYEEAATAYSNYVKLAANKDTSSKASWSRAEIRFLRSFGQPRAVRADAGTGIGCTRCPSSS